MRRIRHGRSLGRFAALIALTALVLAIGVPRPAAAAVEPSAIVGTVTDASGAPVVGAQWFIFSGTCDLCAFGFTAADGSYGGAGLDSTMGPYYVDVFPPTPALASGQVGPITLTPGQTTTANVVLQQQAFITGKVTGPSGKPLSGITVEATGPGAAGGATTTAADGTYSFGLNPVVSNPGPTTVEFNVNAIDKLARQWWNNQPSAATATPISYLPGQTVTGINAQLSHKQHNK
jgi:hypothetical protein